MTVIRVLCGVLVVGVLGLLGCGGGGAAANTKPLAAFTVNLDSASAGTVFTFDAAGCADAEDARDLLQVRWDWDGDGTWDTGYATGKTQTIALNTAGTHVVTLEVKDSGGLTSTVSHEVVVTSATSPTAAFTISPATGETDTAFSFDATVSSDPQDAATALQVRWDWTNDGIWDTAYSSTQTTAYTFSVAGTYTVKVGVKNTRGLTGIARKTVTVAAIVLPTAAFTVTPASGTPATSFAFDASTCSDAGDPVATLQVRWDWENDSTWDTAFSTTKTATHTFAAGNHTVKLEVKNTHGRTASVTRVVKAYEPPAAALAVSAATGAAGTEILFDASGSSDACDAASALQARWDWENDGTWDTMFAQAKTVYHAFASAGTFTVAMQVKNTAGYTATTTRSITITAAATPYVLRAFSSPTYTPGVPVQVVLRGKRVDGVDHLFQHVTDTVPAGWTVSNLTSTGTGIFPTQANVFEAASHRVDFALALGSYLNEDIVFSYTITPPASATGVQSWSGTMQLVNKPEPLAIRGEWHLVPVASAQGFTR